MVRSKRPVLFCAFWILLFASLCLPGCGIKQPTAKVTDANVGEVTLKQVKVNFTVKMFNPNSMPINIKKLAYTFQAFDKIVTEDETDREIRIPENGDAFFKLPITVSFSKLVNAGIETLSRGRLEYTLAAKITVSTPVGPLVLPLKKSGTLRDKDLSRFFNLGENRDDTEEEIVTEETIEWTVGPIGSL